MSGQAYRSSPERGGGPAVRLVEGSEAVGRTILSPAVRNRFSNLRYRLSPMTPPPLRWCATVPRPRRGRTASITQSSPEKGGGPAVRLVEGSEAAGRTIFSPLVRNRFPNLRYRLSPMPPPPLRLGRNGPPPPRGADCKCISAYFRYFSGNRF